MTPEERQMLTEIYGWMQERRQQQLSYPVDLASKAALGAVVKVGTGAHALTQSISVGAGGGTFNVPAAFTGTFAATVEGQQLEIPYL